MLGNLSEAKENSSEPELPDTKAEDELAQVKEYWINEGKKLRAAVRGLEEAGFTPLDALDLLEAYIQGGYCK